MKALSPIFILTFVLLSIITLDKRLIVLCLLGGIAAHYIIHLFISSRYVIIFLINISDHCFYLFLKNYLNRFSVPAETAVLITGCSTGIGEDAALTFSDLGFYVFATVRYFQNITISFM